MATNSANLDTAIANLTAQLVTITANPKPTYSVDGQNVDWAGYLQMVTTQLNFLMKTRQDMDGPWISTIRGVTT